MRRSGDPRRCADRRVPSTMSRGKTRVLRGDEGEMHTYALIRVPSELACLRLITAPLFQTGSRVLPGPIRCIEATARAHHTNTAGLNMAGYQQSTAYSIVAQQLWGAG